MQCLKVLQWSQYYETMDVWGFFFYTFGLSLDSDQGLCEYRAYAGNTEWVYTRDMTPACMEEVCSHSFKASMMITFVM